MSNGRRFTGIGASPGMALGEAVIVSPNHITLPKSTSENPHQEFSLFNDACDVVVHNLQAYYNQTKELMGLDHAMIFKAHIQMVKDPELKKQVKNRLYNKQQTAAFAVQEVIDAFCDTLSTSSDSYMKERIHDMVDIKQQLLRELLDVSSQMQALKQDVILFTDTLTPSDTIHLDLTHVQGFVTMKGGKTSHTAILARSMGLPAIVGADISLDDIEPRTRILINGDKEEVIVDPTNEEIMQYKAYKQEQKETEKTLQQYTKKRTVLQDDTSIQIGANIRRKEDIIDALDVHAEGIGLFRTEYLYMDETNLPSESKQIEVYEYVLSQMSPKQVIIRTLDIGGDKIVHSMSSVKESNPFLGERSIRFSLANQQLFKIQLRALLQASTSGNLAVMIPLVASIEEIYHVKELIEECKEELKQEGLKYSSFQIGIMVEVPSIAFDVAHVASDIDFISIGTNDLLQYTFAADRLNPKVSYLQQPHHPSFLRFLNHIIETAKQHEIWVGVCGEMANNPVSSGLLVAMGVDELSMNIKSIPKIRAYLSNKTMDELNELKQHILKQKTLHDVATILEDMDL